MYCLAQNDGSRKHPSNRRQYGYIQHDRTSPSIEIISPMGKANCFSANYVKLRCNFSSLMTNKCLPSLHVSIFNVCSGSSLLRWHPALHKLKGPATFTLHQYEAHNRPNKSQLIIYTFTHFQMKNGGLACNVSSSPSLNGWVAIKRNVFPLPHAYLLPSSFSMKNAVRKCHW